MALNWQKSIAPYITKPLFASYGSHEETRPVLVDCALGYNPIEDLYPNKPVFVEMSQYRGYPKGGVHGNAALASYICKRWPTVTTEELCFGAGSHGTICSLSRILGGPKNHIFAALPQFIPGLIEFAVAGCTIHTIELTGPDYTLNVQEFAAKIPDTTTLVYIDNPNNPTGRQLPLHDIAWLAKACAEKGALLLVDEAYGDFIEDTASALTLPDKNIICLRSFSKGCGLAGIRTGYIVIKDPQLRHYYYELGLHFSASALAGDIAAQVLPKLDLGAMRTRVQELKTQVMHCISEKSQFTIAKTHPGTPIMYVTTEEADANLYDQLMDVGIRTESGLFFGQGTHNAVRMRTPSSSDLNTFCAQWKKRFP